MIPVYRFAADQTLRRMPGELALGRVVVVADDEAYVIEGPACVGRESRHQGPLGFGFGGIFRRRERPAVMTLLGDGAVLVASVGAKAGYRLPPLDLRDAIGQLHELDKAAGDEAVRAAARAEDKSMHSVLQNRLSLAIMIFTAGALAEVLIVAGMAAGVIS